MAQETAARDRVTLTNGDQLTGTLKSMADGAIVFHSELLKTDIKIPLSTVKNLSTAAAVTVVQKSGETVKQQITGIKDGRLQVGDATIDMQQLAAGP